MFMLQRAVQRQVSVRPQSSFGVIGKCKNLTSVTVFLSRLSLNAHVITSITIYA
jgi:hypothetical protein